MKRGILIYNHQYEEWQVWIGQQAYLMEHGYSLEIRIVNAYFKAFFERDFDWSITLCNDIIFTLHRHEIYKVRVQIENFKPLDAPFI